MDPSIVQARERVMKAEASEREADRALMAARSSVRDAREHVRRLEIEAEEEARLAKIKQHQAKDIGKRGKQLGRKSPFPAAGRGGLVLTSALRPRHLNRQTHYDTHDFICQACMA